MHKCFSVFLLAIAIAVSAPAGRAQTAPDSITVVLCGTGSPIPSPRAQSCTAVFAGGQFFLFDAGDGAARSMEALNLPITELNSIFLTHFHSDHFADVAEVIDRSYSTGRRGVVTVFGPEGVYEVVDNLMRGYRLGQKYRTDHHGQEMMPPQYWGAVPVEFSSPAGDAPASATRVVYSQGGVVVKAFRANHPPIEPAVGYRLEYAGKVIVISGDSLVTAVLLEQSLEADLLVCNTMNKQILSQIEASRRAAGDTFGENILHDIQEYHMDVTDVGRLAAEAKVKRLALTHLTPAPREPEQIRALFAAPVSALYRGELIVGEDGTRIVIP